MTKRRKHSEETKAKMSAAKKGVPKSEETKAKISAAKMGNAYALGRKHSDEAKAKMSAAGKERCAKRKANQQ